MMKARTVVLAGMLALLSGSCSEWEEPQIDNEQVVILTPRDSLVTEIATQLFYWYGVEGATRYELQIASPDFRNIDRLVLDTNISRTRFEFTLSPGAYEWSVLAYNNSSATGYTVHRLYIDSTLNLGNQQIILKSPGDADTSNDALKLFQWQDLYNVEGYRFELWQPNFSGSPVLFRDTPKDTLPFRVKEEGSYAWRVRGENASSNTIYSSRFFYVDTTRPNIPVLQNPIQGAVIGSGELDFSWNRGTNNGSSLTDEFYLATDSNMTDERQRITLRDNTVSLDTLSPGIYYWRVRSEDKAGNISDFSAVRQFTLQ